MNTIIKINLSLLLLLPNLATAQHEGHNHHKEHAATSAPMDHSAHDHAREETNKGTIWTCSMHPQIKLGKPGKCPICHMDLIPVETKHSSDGDIEAPNLIISKTAEKLMELETSAVERKWVTRPVRLVGKIDYDETRVKHITAWVPGRIDRMYVDYTGIEVKESDHMVSLYSPELVSAQEELIQAARSLRKVQGGNSEMVKRSSRRSLQAAREKLKLLGLTESQVAKIERVGKAEDNVTVYAPMGGVVVEKHVNEGTYVETGTRIYTIADLTHLWLYLDAYESDLPWVSYGQEVEFSAQALPGETFQGVVSFVQPFLDEKTRTVKVRVNVDNQSERLKPGMFVTATIKAKVDGHGHIVGKSYEGKYVCPMHPEVIENTEADCPICGMKLEKAETLPFISKNSEHSKQAPLVIPTSAPLITGKRAVVYVKLPEKSHYEGREIVLGPRAGNYYLVLSGLKEGELVVTKGAFKIDADLQIRGIKSMMNPGGGTPSGGHNH